jgi:hypothetical protein
MDFKIAPAPFGWFDIIFRGHVLQAFRSEPECRAWIAENARFIRLFRHQ